MRESRARTFAVLVSRFSSSRKTRPMESGLQFLQKVDNAIHRINLYSLDKAIGFPNAYPLDRDLSDE